MAKKKNPNHKAKDAMRYMKALVREVTDDGRLLGVVGSTSAVDRYEEIIDQNTWKLEHYKNNPVILWAHNLTFGEDRPPIGRASRVEIQDGNLVFDIQFDMKDPFAADIFRKYKEKFLNAFSVGFIPHAFGEDDEGHLILMNNELLELSAVPVPANPEALQGLRARSFAARSWKAMLKEADESQATQTQEAEDDIDEEAGDSGKPEDKKPDTEKKPEDTNAGDGIAATDSQPETEDGEGNSGEKAKRNSSPENPQLAAQRTLVAVMREATRQMQSALALHNASMRADKGKTHKERSKTKL